MTDTQFRQVWDHGLGLGEAERPARRIGLGSTQLQAVGGGDGTAGHDSPGLVIRGGRLAHAPTTVARVAGETRVAGVLRPWSRTVGTGAVGTGRGVDQREGSRVRHRTGCGCLGEGPGELHPGTAVPYSSGCAPGHATRACGSRYPGDIGSFSVSGSGTDPAPVISEWRLEILFTVGIESQGGEELTRGPERYLLSFGDELLRAFLL